MLPTSAPILGSVFSVERADTRNESVVNLTRFVRTTGLVGLHAIITTINRQDFADHVSACTSHTSKKGRNEGVMSRVDVSMT